MSPDTPTVSVVVPSYNGTAFLRQSLPSALAQTHRPLEVIVVNYSSTDGSPTKADCFGPPVRIIRQSNQGACKARNVGLESARGESVGLLGAIAAWGASNLHLQARAIRLHAESSSLKRAHRQISRALVAS